jgi:hypothetical protein
MLKKCWGGLLVVRQKVPVSMKTHCMSTLDDNETDEDRLMREKVLKEAKDELNKKISRYVRLLERGKINRSFLLQNLNSVPLASADEEALKEEIYSDQEKTAHVESVFSNSKQLLEMDSHVKYLIPSVSNIIEIATESTSKNLINWKLAQIKSLGEEGFSFHQKKLREEGEAFHKYMAHRVTNNAKDSSLPTPTFDNMDEINRVLKAIDKVQLVEKGVCYENLFYNGRIDCLAYYNGDLCLIDWKLNSKRKEDIKSLYDVPVQIAAYLGAFLNDPRYESLRREHKVKYGMIVNVERETGFVDVHLINYQLAEYYWYKWLVFLKKFWASILKNKNKS